MVSETFYSDRTGQPQPRVREVISAAVWRGLATLLLRRVDNGSLAQEFPAYGCPDHPSAITGTNPQTVDSTLGTLIPALNRTRGISDPTDSTVTLLNPYQAPSTPVALDVVDFVGLHIVEPAKRRQHLQHEHLEFDQPASRLRGQRRFCQEVELIFARNGIAFTIGDDMKTGRLGPPEARPLLSEFAPNTGDARLDEMLRDAHPFPVAQPTGPYRRSGEAVGRLRATEVPGGPGRQEGIDCAAPRKGGWR